MTYKIETKGVDKTGKPYRNLVYSNKDYSKSVKVPEVTKENSSKVIKLKKSKGKSYTPKGKKILRTPQAKVKKISSKQMIKGFMKQGQRLVSEGKEGFFNDDYSEEKKRWLS